MNPARLLTIVRTADHIASVVLGLSFVFSGMSHALNPYLLLDHLARLNLLPLQSCVGVAFILPMVEIVLAIALLTEQMMEGARVLSTTLLTTFCLVHVIEYIVRNGAIDSCGCFGNYYVLGGRSTAFCLLAISVLMLLASRFLRLHTCPSGTAVELAGS